MGKGRAQRERARKLAAKQAAEAAQAAEDVKQALQNANGMIRYISKGKKLEHLIQVGREEGQRLFNLIYTSQSQRHGGLEDHEVEFCRKAFETPTNDTILEALKIIQKCLQSMSETRSALGSGVLEEETDEDEDDAAMYLDLDWCGYPENPPGLFGHDDLFGEEKYVIKAGLPLQNIKDT